jgi:hypothetical protein
VAALLLHRWRGRGVSCIAQIRHNIYVISITICKVVITSSNRNYSLLPNHITICKNFYCFDITISATREIHKLSTLLPVSNHDGRTTARGESSHVRLRPPCKLRAQLCFECRSIQTLKLYVNSNTLQILIPTPGKMLVHKS